MSDYSYLTIDIELAPPDITPPWLTDTAALAKYLTSFRARVMSRLGFMYPGATITMSVSATTSAAPTLTCAPGHSIDAAAIEVVEKVVDGVENELLAFAVSV